jgi:hypothetical protein
MFSIAIFNPGMAWDYAASEWFVDPFGVISVPRATAQRDMMLLFHSANKSYLGEFQSFVLKYGRSYGAIHELSL